MKITKQTWLKARVTYGEFIARQHLGLMTKRAKIECHIRTCHTKRDPLFMANEMAFLPSSSPMVNRKRYASFIRKLIALSREHRLTILGYCAPGVPRQFLP